jgi:hypothetical protein
MKDFLGRELNVGDTVVFSIPKYHGLAKAHIDHFSKKMVVFDVFYSYGHKLKPMSEAGKHDRAVCRYPGDCVKVEDEDD